MILALEAFHLFLTVERVFLLFIFHRLFSFPLSLAVGVSLLFNLHHSQRKGEIEVTASIYTFSLFSFFLPLFIPVFVIFGLTSVSLQYLGLVGRRFVIWSLSWEAFRSGLMCYQISVGRDRRNGPTFPLPFRFCLREL